MKGFRDQFGCLYDTKGKAWGVIPVFYNADNDRVPVATPSWFWDLVMGVTLYLRQLLGRDSEIIIHEEGPLGWGDLPPGF